MRSPTTWGSARTTGWAGWRSGWWNTRRGWTASSGGRPRPLVRRQDGSDLGHLGTRPDASYQPTVPRGTAGRRWCSGADHPQPAGDGGAGGRVTGRPRAWRGRWWRRLRAGHPRTGETLSWLERQEAILQLELVLVETFGKTLPPEIEPLRGFARRGQLTWRQTALANTRRRRVRQELLRWVRRVLTLGMEWRQSCAWSPGHPRCYAGCTLDCPESRLGLSVRVRSNCISSGPIRCCVLLARRPPWLTDGRRILRWVDAVDSHRHASSGGCTCFGGRWRTCEPGSCRPCRPCGHSACRSGWIASVPRWVRQVLTLGMWWR